MDGDGFSLPKDKDGPHTDGGISFTVSNKAPTPSSSSLSAAAASSSSAAASVSPALSVGPLGRRMLIEVIDSGAEAADGVAGPDPDDPTSGPGEGALSRAVPQTEEEDDADGDGGDDGDDDTIECVLALLAGILGAGEERRTDEEERVIRLLLSPLQKIAFRSVRPSAAASSSLPEKAVDFSFESNVSRTAGDVAMLILSRSYNQSKTSAAAALLGLKTLSTSQSPPQSQSLSQSQPNTVVGSDSTTGSGSGSGPGPGTPPTAFVAELQRLCSNEFLFSQSPAMQAYGARILLQYVKAAGRSSSSSSSSAATKVSFTMKCSFVYCSCVVAVDAEVGSVFTISRQV
jgi:hypothetical protein